MKHGYHYTPCNTSSSGPSLWVLLKLAAAVGTTAGVWWLLKAIGRATAAAFGAAAETASAAAPAILGTAGIIIATAAVLVATMIVRNNQRPPLLPHDRPHRRGLLQESTVEVIEVTPNRRRLSPPQPAQQPFASRDRIHVLR